MTLYELHERPELDEPTLVVCLEGWIDAGMGAATAVASLLEQLDTRVIATFDADELLDHRARRPVMRIEDGVNVGLAWPEIQLLLGHDRNGVPVLVLVGAEPDHLWRRFCADVVELTRSLGVRLVVGLGAFPAPVPHTRPCLLASTATTEALAREVGYVQGVLNVPAGVHAALERAFAEVDVPAVGLWARVPHYVAGMAYPEASAALLEQLAALTGLRVDTDDLRAQAVETRRRVDELVFNNPEHAELVHQLEAQADAEAGAAGDGDIVPGTLPSGDDLAAEVERFLRGESGPT